MADSSRLPPLAPAHGGSAAPLYGTGWDACNLGADQLPGLWRVVAGGIQLKLDKKSKPGADGANPTIHGLEPERFEIEGHFSTNEQRDKITDLCKKLLPQPGVLTPRKPMPLSHPSVEHFGMPINVIVVGSGIHEVIGVGRSKLRLLLQHWLPAQSTNVATKTHKQSERKTTSSITQPQPKPTESGAGQGSGQGQAGKPGSIGPPNFTAT